MSLRSGKSISAVIPYVRIAPGGSVNLVMEYTAYDGKGIPRRQDPTAIQVEVVRPDGSTWSAQYPDMGVVRQDEGRYCCSIPVSMVGTYIFRVRTDAGTGPSEEGQFEVREDT